MNLQTFTKGMLMALVTLVVLNAPPVTGKTSEQEQKKKAEKKQDKEKGSSVLRVPRQAYENIKNRVSDVEFYSSNYGIFGLNVAAGQAGGIWPRGSNQAYIFGGGVWFGAQKVRPNGDTSKLSVVGYNPNSGASWMVPGRVTTPLNRSVIDESLEGINKYRMYFSTDYNSFTGEPFDAADIAGPNWPIWDVSLVDTVKRNRYFGTYIEDVNQRNLETFPEGPAFVSGEDIFSIYKDTDLSKYEKISRDTAVKKGYPIGIQVEQIIYSWGFGLYKDFMFIKYTIINKSGEDLLNCYMAPVMDIDIGNAGNDHATIFIPNRDDDTLNLAIQWTEGESSTKRFGYLGCDFLESPAVDDLGYIRKDKRVYTEKEQIGMTTFQNWPIEEDPATDEARYEFMSDRSQRDVDIGPGDRRFLTATGPFNMRAGDTARVVVGLMFAYGRGQVATGRPEDTRELIAVDTFAQRVYDENFLAPDPPEPANVSWRPLNNGVELNWDTRSERSLDRQERGLDFAGYTIKRARRSVGFPDADSTDGWNLGFKTVGGFKIPAVPDSAVRYEAARTGQLSMLGAWWRLPMLADTADTGLIDANRATVAFDSITVYRWDTLHHGGTGNIEVVRGPAIGKKALYGFDFDPYDDHSNDSTIFNNRDFGPVFGDKFKNKAIRDVVRDAIVEIMDSVTDGRRFVDVGDDNGNGSVDVNQSDLKQNERLVNNVDYYYQVLAFDAGSAEGTPPKINSGIAGINEVRATPEAPSAGPPVSPRVIRADGLGGIHDFRFVTLDNDRLGQLFGGDTIEFEFQPLFPTALLPDSARALGTYFPHYYYLSEVIVRSLNRDKELMRFPVSYGGFTDRADSAPPRLLDSGLITRYIIEDGDTTFHDGRNVSVPYNLSFIADPLRPVYGIVGIYKNTFTVGFDYSFIQQGDSLRIGVFGDTTFTQSPIQITTAGDANVAPGKQTLGQTARAGQGELVQRIPSFGQPKIEIEFTEGGTERVTVSKNNRDFSFDANYLNVKVRNIASYTRQVFDANGNPTDETVEYNYEYPADPQAKVKADTTSTVVTVERVIDIDKYALYAYAWVNPDKLTPTQRKIPIARSRSFVGVSNNPKYYIGTPNRYYTGSYTIDTATIKFSHNLVVNGSQIFLDFAGMGAPSAQVDTNYVRTTPPSTDFKPGDKVVVSYAGGTLGLPQPGAKVWVEIPSAKPKLEEYTDDMLDQITIVPNPYLISHIGQTANSDRKIYFTRLPEKCTIQLYTEAGELLQTLEHDATVAGGENGRVAVEVWDVLTKSDRQAQSQLIVARITTPNGAETIKKVAVVVGGFRLNNR